MTTNVEIFATLEFFESMRDFISPLKVALQRSFLIDPVEVDARIPSFSCPEPSKCVLGGGSHLPNSFKPSDTIPPPNGSPQISTIPFSPLKKYPKTTIGKRHTNAHWNGWEGKPGGGPGGAHNGSRMGVAHRGLEV